jgi:hypothetical protein
MKAAILALLGLFISQDIGAAIGRLRAGWARQDASAIIGGSSRVVIQLPGAPATAPLNGEQAARAIAAVFADATELGLEIDALREVSGEAVYAELRRRYRVRGSESVTEQRVFAALRAEDGKWRLSELRIGQGGR